MARPFMTMLLSVCVLSVGAGGATVVVLDNDTPGVTLTGTWNASSSTPGFIGPNYSHNGQVQTSTATYAPTLPYAGLYQVDAIWTGGSNRNPTAQYTINYTGGPTTVIQDQRTGGGTWQALGTFQFTGTAADTVLLSAQVGSTGYLIADGMRFVDPATIGTGGDRLIPSAGLTATASSTVGAPQNGRVPQAAVDGAGMSDWDLDGVDDTHPVHQYGDYISWMSTGNDTAGWFVVDLGAEYPLEEIKFWNFNSAQEKDRGVSMGDWYVSTALNPTGRVFAGDPDWTLAVDDFAFTMAPGTGSYRTPDVIDMGGLTARWVALDIAGNLGDSLFVGISEMQFFQAEIPEPLTMTALLAGLGLAGGYVRRRRSA